MQIRLWYHKGKLPWHIYPYSLLVCKKYTDKNRILEPCPSSIRKAKNTGYFGTRIRQHKRDTSRPNYKPEPRQATRKPNKYGRIPGIEPGATFSSRQACADAGVHGVALQGIHGSPTTGAYSVCLSGTYEDDKDDGDFYVYTDSGGKVDAFCSSSKHVGDQFFANSYNKSLKMSVVLRRPVRVVRGPNENSKWAPTTGYRYDGLYRVVKAYYGRGSSGHRVCKFEFRRLPGQTLLPLKST